MNFLNRLRLLPPAAARQLLAAVALAVLSLSAPAAHAVLNPALPGTYRIKSVALKLNGTAQAPLPVAFNPLATIHIGQLGFQSNKPVVLAREFAGIIAASGFGPNVKLYPNPGFVATNSIGLVALGSTNGNWNADILVGSATVTLRAKQLQISLKITAKNPQAQVQSLGITIKLNKKV